MSEKKYATDYPPTMPLRERLTIMHEMQKKYPNEQPVQRIAQYITMFYVEDIDPENILNGKIPVNDRNFVDITKIPIEDIVKLSCKYGLNDDIGFVFIMLMIAQCHVVVQTGTGFDASVFIDIDKMRTIYEGFPDIVEQMTKFKEMFGTNLINTKTFTNIDNAYKRILAEKKKIAAFKDIVEKNNRVLSKAQVLEFIEQFP